MEKVFLLPVGVENADNYVEHGIEATSYETTDGPADQAQVVVDSIPS